MKRLTLLLLVLVMSMAMALPASANQPTDELTALAEFAPAESVFFGVARIDDGYAATLEEVINSRLEVVAATLPEGTVPPSVSADDFAPVAEFRAFAGDYAAVFFPSAQAIFEGSSDSVFAAVVPVEDFDAAVAYFDDLNEFDIEFGDVEKIEQEDGSVLYQSNVSFIDSTLVTPEFAITGDIESVILPGMDAASLADTEDFQNAVAALPEDAYNILGYVNLDPVVAIIEEFAPAVLDGTGITIDYEVLADSLGQIAVGFTLLEGRVFTIDMAQVAPALLDAQPLDLTVLDNVPGDTPFIIHGNGIGGTLAGLLDSLYMLNDMLLEAGLLPIPEAGPLDFVGPDDLATFITLSLEGTYNIDLEETLAWMDNDFVLAMRPRLEAENLLTSNVDLSLLLGTDNPEATAAIVEEFAKDVIAQFSAATFDDGTLRVPFGALISRDDLAVLAMTANDTFMAMGTELYTNELGNTDAPVTGTDHYAFESSLFLEDPFMLLYIDLEPLVGEAREALELSGLVPPFLLEAFDGASNLIDTSSITFARADGIATARFTITLGELE